MNRNYHKVKIQAAQYEVNHFLFRLLFILTIIFIFNMFFTAKCSASGEFSQPIVIGDLDGDIKGDLIIDFGLQNGVWARYSDGSWEKIHDLSPEIMTTGDIDGDTKDDIVIDFGPELGVWTRYSDGTWAHLHDLSPESIIIGNIDNDSADKTIIDFGTEYGIWIRHLDGSWERLHDLSPEFMTTGDIDGDAKDDIVIDFGAELGVWARYSDGSWEKIHDLSPWDMNQPLLVRSIIDFGYDDLDRLKDMVCDVINTTYIHDEVGNIINVTTEKEPG